MLWFGLTQCFMSKAYADILTHTSTLKSQDYWSLKTILNFHQDFLNNK